MKSLFKKKEESSKPTSNVSDTQSNAKTTPRTGNLFGFKSLGAKSKSDSEEGLKRQTKSGSASADQSPETSGSIVKTSVPEESSRQAYERALAEDQPLRSRPSTLKSNHSDHEDTATSSGQPRRRPSTLQKSSMSSDTASTDSLDGRAQLKRRPSTLPKAPMESGLSSESLQNSGQSTPLKRRPSTISRTSQDGGSDAGQLKPHAATIRRPSAMRMTSITDASDGSSGDVQSNLDRSMGMSEMKALLEKQRQDLASLSLDPNSGGTPKLNKLKQEAIRRDSFTTLDFLKTSPEDQINRKVSDGGKSARDTESSENWIRDSLTGRESVAERKEQIRRRWRDAIDAVTRGVGSGFMSGKAVNATALQIVQSSQKAIVDQNQELNESGRGGFSFKNTGRSDAHRAKIIEVLSKPIAYRSAPQLMALDLILKNYPAFSRYSKSMRAKLVEKGSLLELEPYRVVIRQNQAPWAIYFLLSGRCHSETVVVHRSQGFIRRREINAGEAFGEFSMINPSAKRIETVSSLTPVLMLSVPRDIYVDLMRAEIMASRNEIVDIMKSVGPYKSFFTGGQIDKFLAACQLFKYDANIPILKAGDRSTVTFILDGQCRANRLVPFLVKKGDPGEKGHGEITNAYTPGADIPPGEDVVYHNLSIGLLNSGDYFPKISLLRSEALEYRLQKVDVLKVIALMNGILQYTLVGSRTKLDESNIGFYLSQDLDEKMLDIEDAIAGVDLSIFSSDKVTCLVINKLDLVNILSLDTLHEILHPEAEGLVGIRIDEIQQNYFEKIQWKGFRKEVVQGVIKPRRETKKAVA